jgi:hypothetical protein
MTITQLLVRQDQLGATRVRTGQEAPLAPGEVRVRVDSFSLTANNITYAAFGEAMNYWQFFPAGEAGWGIVPVWGFGTVVQSLHPGVAVGECLYGYWPMASEAILRPQRLNADGFSDAATHRAALHAVYNHYRRCNTDPFHVDGQEDAESVYRPLFMTSWLIDDFLAEHQFFGASTVLLSSASSKTAYGTAFMLAQRPGLSVAGLTSPANRAFCESLGCYSRVLGYDELAAVPAQTPSVYVDFAGNAQLRRAIHQRFEQLKYSCSVGGTHVEQLGGARDLPGPRATLFFAPAQVKQRQQDWGADELNRRLLAGWRGFLGTATDPLKPWLQARHHRGAAEVQDAYALVLSGRSDPREGHILSLA